MKTPLKVQIEALNEMNQIFSDVLPKIKEALNPFIDKKILKVDGYLTKEVKTIIDKILSQFDTDKGTRIYLDTTCYSLWLKLTVCKSGGSYDNKTYYCQYFSESVYIGKTEYQKLIEVDINHNAKEYNEPEILSLIKKYEVIKGKYEIEIDSLNRSIPSQIRESYHLKK